MSSAWKSLANFATTLAGATGSTSDIIKSVGPLKRPLYLATSLSDFDVSPLSIAFIDKLFLTTFALAPDLRGHGNQHITLLELCSANHVDFLFQLVAPDGP